MQKVETYIDRKIKKQTKIIGIDSYEKEKNGQRNKEKG
jgi:hypothetical protein